MHGVFGGGFGFYACLLYDFISLSFSATKENNTGQRPEAGVEQKDFVFFFDMEHFPSRLCVQKLCLGDAAGFLR